MIDGGIPKGSQGGHKGASRIPGSITPRSDSSTGSKCPVCAQAHGGRRAYLIPATCNEAVMTIWKARSTDEQGLATLWQRFTGLEGKSWWEIKELLNKRAP